MERSRNAAVATRGQQRRIHSRDDRVQATNEDQPATAAKDTAQLSPRRDRPRAAPGVESFTRHDEDRSCCDAWTLSDHTRTTQPCVRHQDTACRNEIPDLPDA